MVRTVLLLPKTALKNRDMLRSFVWRDLASRYEGSLLGRLWPVVYPLLLLGIYHLVFAKYLKLKFGDADYLSAGWETTFYMLSGILPWLAFADTLSRSTNVVVENSNLIKKIAFPSELLPTCVSVTHLIHFLISATLFLLLYVCVVLSEGQGAALGNLWLLPIPILLQFVLGLGLGMLLATVNVFARDLNHVMPVGLLLWMLISPIFYPVYMVQQMTEEDGEEWILTLMQFNPIYHLLAMYRSVFRADPTVEFAWGSCGILSLFAVFFLFAGYWLFIRVKGQFADEV